ncbi:tRNA pseudouridine synthase B [Hypnocyclicus thermotrophus]|uniref:tRNA pseudouridine synthase B n=1 Tax=Hypnocyclicus thermotrophus TaxID=1627895 RepID=A0AA46I5Q3_9FUSO|nr:tRNA pseudouridine(55) synthase TruB [Hypnocyclicus thermotrophus]TDT69195.1 tRNA pseudouridine synthase B [Hypnocyclicus thermotrophus]
MKLEGIININKPKGITSFDVIRKLRKILKERRIGHTGTLDPLAEGVLVICVGKVTKLASLIEAKSKTYIAEFEFGYKTDTYDVTGNIIEKTENFIISKEKLINILKKFEGEIKQIPPMYSAIKVDGKKLYELAREGKEIERKARKIKIDYIKLLEFDAKKAKIECKVSKGTYIRSLIYDIGEELECFATMTSLIRTKVGKYNIKNSFTIEEIEGNFIKNNIDFLLRVEESFDFNNIEIKEKIKKNMLINGNKISYKGENGYYKIYFDNKFWGIGIIENNYLKPYKYFNIE